MASAALNARRPGIPTARKHAPSTSFKYEEEAYESDESGENSVMSVDNSEVDTDDMEIVERGSDPVVHLGSDLPEAASKFGQH